jgi:hypothetical protein
LLGCNAVEANAALISNKRKPVEDATEPGGAAEKRSRSAEELVLFQKKYAVDVVRASVFLGQYQKQGSNSSGHDKDPELLENLRRSMRGCRTQLFAMLSTVYCDDRAPIIMPYGGAYSRACWDMDCDRFSIPGYVRDLFGHELFPFEEVVDDFARLTREGNDEDWTALGYANPEEVVTPAFMGHVHAAAVEAAGRQPAIEGRNALALFAGSATCAELRRTLLKAGCATCTCECMCVSRAVGKGWLCAGGSVTSSCVCSYPASLVFVCAVGRWFLHESQPGSDESRNGNHGCGSGQPWLALRGGFPALDEDSVRCAGRAGAKSAGGKQRCP